MANSNPNFSAAAPALGYLYQVRYALYKILQIPERHACFIEKDDDVDFSDDEEGQILASLKHKAPGDTLSDKSPDFWKSVRIWLSFLKSDIGKLDTTYFYLVTTGVVDANSFLGIFLPTKSSQIPVEQAKNILLESKSRTLAKVKELMDGFNDELLESFFRRITIFDQQERIENLPSQIIERHFRAQRPQFRMHIYESLEGWWIGEVIKETS